MAKSGKGSDFERSICKQLSLWWTDNERDDVFWRTAGSGAMAKTRSKSNRQTFGQYGDIQATDPIGQPLIDLCSIELKRGYSRTTFHDILDASNKAAEQQYHTFINQARTDAHNAKAKYWVLITKRDRREPLICMPFSLYKHLKPQLKQSLWRVKFRYPNENIFITKLEYFLSYVTADNIRELNEKRG